LIQVMDDADLFIHIIVPYRDSTQNSKSEYRNPKQTGANKSQTRKIQNIESEMGSFGTLYSFPPF
jgi:hypothetical protein